MGILKDPLLYVLLIAAAILAIAMQGPTDTYPTEGVLVGPAQTLNPETMKMTGTAKTVVNRDNSVTTILP